ncbi:type I-C CRISPR-associated protein Cas7/Csd2 [Methanosarcina sp.]|uniref:type I-C CRISPR-associated protein Cas7/Csd2 n=1 Tax=Methanosarcina sp. TaxID=2213 RepID=UPI002988CCAE|nr:type I-C CRISPR-associated protein Cas7/Csd2 [Methanosarcina sp.]MDW5551527.1 type I-C CRISPR-associated protein Cas7/Csd2 [Methanosarcina sp.]MDW5555429.1 type I-C CRISPR-associated protein Cas7/Csd2 [Methanosarcina sp.]MDW5560065.1 type I-C CRISPR-associated protein Cas7/Csd2 [Methanosarcina sp.]
MSEIIKNRYEFVLLFDVENGNPNGDPDMGNMPRVDPQTGNGIVTDVCLKRKVRDYVDLVKNGNAGYEIYVKSGAVLNSQHKKAYDYLGINPDSKKPKDDELTKFMCQNFFDIRTFGAVMTTEINCGQVRGPVQFSFARSTDPIFQQEVTVTRCAVTNEKDAEKGQTMGKKQIVPYGLYRAEGYISAHLAKKTEFTEDDLELLWASLINMFEHDHSAARGKMSARKLIVFKHNSELGCCQSHVLFDKVKVERLSHDMPSRSFADYKVTIADDMPNGVELIEKL